jgi:pilus assembly protein Flp/PilA
MWKRHKVNQVTGQHAQRTPSARPRVLLVSVGPLVRGTLARRLSWFAEVCSVEYGTPACEEAVAAFEPQVAILDLTYLRSFIGAQDVAGRLADEGVQLLFLGYANDRGEEASLSAELGAVFNPTLDEIIEVVRAAEADPGATTVAPAHVPSQPGLPAGRDVAPGDDQTRGKGGTVMNLTELFLRIKHEQKGQTLAEYGLIIALVALVAMAALTGLQGGVTELLGDIKGKLQGAA